MPSHNPLFRMTAPRMAALWTGLILAAPAGAIAQSQPGPVQSSSVQSSPVQPGPVQPGPAPSPAMPRTAMVAGDADYYHQVRAILAEINLIDLQTSLVKSRNDYKAAVDGRPAQTAAQPQPAFPIVQAPPPPPVRIPVVTPKSEPGTPEAPKSEPKSEPKPEPRSGVKLKSETAGRVPTELVEPPTLVTLDGGPLGYRATLRVDGQVYEVSQPGPVGPWTVTAIGSSTVTLTRSGKTITLHRSSDGVIHEYR